MTRFLFVVPPLAGHVNPTISVGRELVRRGHQVAWTGPPGETGRLLPDDATFVPAGHGAVADVATQLRDRHQRLRHTAALKFLWEEVLIPLAYAMADDVDALVESWEPDVVVADQQALAGAAIARKRQLPWATTATTSAELVDPLADLPLVGQWVNDRLADLQSALDVPRPLAEAGDLRFSEHLVLVFSTLTLVGRDHSFPPHYVFVGPSITDRPERQHFPWGWLDPQLPHVLVSLGSLSNRASRRFFTVAAEALAGEPVQAILTAPPDLLDQHVITTHNLLVQEQVPMLALLPHLQAVVCHGGHNTVCESLAHGLPLVLAPIRDDQPIVADQVVRAGAGLRVRFTRVRPSDLRIATRHVLDQPSFRQAATTIRRSFQAAGGPAAAATHLENLATTAQDREIEGAEPVREAG